jgi:hypothetical protein
MTRFTLCSGTKTGGINRASNGCVHTANTFSTSIISTFIEVIAIFSVVWCVLTTGSWNTNKGSASAVRAGYFCVIAFVGACLSFGHTLRNITFVAEAVGIIYAQVSTCRVYIFLAITINRVAIICEAALWVI